MDYMLRDKARRLSQVKKKQLILQCIELWQEENSNPSCELYYETAYQLLVSVVLSAQATDKIVNRVMVPIYKKGFDIDSVLALKQEGVYKLIKSIGLAPTKAKNIYNLTNILLARHKSQVPSDRESLEELPGVGRKTANVILGEIFKQPTLAVDTHVFRVGKRLGLHNEKNALKAEQSLLSIIPEEFLPKLHHWFILHGRYVCKAKKPLCSECTVRHFCPSVDKIKSNS
jgi:endonuclease III